LPQFYIREQALSNKPQKTLTLAASVAYSAVMLRVMYPGTFDPPTNGHLDIINRAAQIFDEVEIVIAIHPEKKTFFSPDERFDMMSRLVAGLPNVRVHRWEGLVVEMAERLGARIMVRGVRALSDFNYEFELSTMNRALNPRIETIFLPTDQKYFVLRSSGIKEVARLGGDISLMVPPIVAEALRAKLGRPPHA
jgi:pantetheine-phosphate adenylyltransferase